MNKLLRNPWVVAALVVGMAALWWVQMRAIFYPGGMSDAVPAEVVVNDPSSAPLPTDETTVADTLTIEPLSEHELKPTALRWVSVPSRDPFGPLRKPVVAEAALAEVPVQSTAEPAVVAVPSLPALPTLEAVLNTPSAHIAVIDGRMVRVGDRVSGRAVLKIDHASVALGRSADTDQPLLLKLPSR